MSTLVLMVAMVLIFSVSGGCGDGAVWFLVEG